MDIVNLLYVALTIYALVIFAWIVLSWFRIGYGHPLHPVERFLFSVVDPYLRLFRGLVPPIQAGGMALDLSALIGIVLIGVARGIVASML